MPSTACLVADLIGATRAASFDLGAACSGFVYGLVQATALVEAGVSERVLVVAGEVFTRFTDFTDRSNSFLWGDAGAGALVVAAGPDEARGVLGFELGADGAGANLITIPAGGSRSPLPPAENGRSTGRAESTFIQMEGREVFRFAVRTVVESVTRVLAACGLHVSDWLVPPPDHLLGRGLMGDGVIPIRELSQEVEAAGYGGPVEVEIFNRALWDLPGDQALELIKTRFVDRV